MRQHRSLGKPGRARGELDVHDVVGTDRPLPGLALVSPVGSIFQNVPRQPSRAGRDIQRDRAAKLG